MIYPGSIERVDFGEVEDDKFFVIAEVERGQTKVDWRQLKQIRPFVDCSVSLDSPEGITDKIRETLPHPDQLEDAIVRLVLNYPREWEPMIDDAALREYTAGAFEFHLVKRPQMESRVRLPEGQLAGSMTPLTLLETYWGTQHLEPGDIEKLQSLAASVLNEEENQEPSLEN